MQAFLYQNAVASLLLLAAHAALSGCNGPRTTGSPVARAGAPAVATPQGGVDAARDSESEAAASPPAPEAEAGLDAALPAISDKDPWLVRCLKRASELKCGIPARCRESCAKMRGATFCKPQVNAFMACLMKAPREQWSCDDDGQPALRDAACLPERAGVLDCLHTSDGRL